jgi:hypothetical protein
VTSGEPLRGAVLAVRGSRFLAAEVVLYRLAASSITEACAARVADGKH